MRYVVVMVLLCSGLMVETADATGVLERESLRGLSGVFVVIDQLGPEGTRSGLSVETIRTAVERILRASGIQVLTEKEGPTGLSAAMFAITATPVKSAYVAVSGVNVTGVIIQQVLLKNGSEMKTPAITWGKSHTAVVSVKAVKPEVMRHVVSLTKDFASDFLSVNSQ